MDEKPLVYPPVVLAHIVSDIKDYLRPKINDRDSVEIHYSAQLNGHPHMGTLTSLATAFAVGKYIQNTFSIPAILKFEALDNAPIGKFEVGDREYCKMHAHYLVEGRPLSEIHLDSFLEVMDFFSESTGVEFNIETYQEFQADSFVRRTLIDIIQRENEFVHYIAPSEGQLRVRFPCNTCNVMEKTSKDTAVVGIPNSEEFEFESYCPEHGKYNVTVGVDNNTMVDFNTSLRNVIKEAKFIQDAKDKNAMNLMVDGGDWTGMAFQVIHSLGMLGYTIFDLPVRIFSPIIEDWSGAKFSKSVYVKEGTYRHVPEEFLNFMKFKESFGQGGLVKILDESNQWVKNPKKLFRNYSTDYFRKVFNI